MRRQTKFCIDLRDRHVEERHLAAWIDAGADAVIQTYDGDSTGKWIETRSSVRRIESSTGRPLPLILDLPDSAMADELTAEMKLGGIDMIAVSADRGGAGIETLRKSLPEVNPVDIIAKFDSAKCFLDIERIVQAADAVTIDLKGLQSLAPSESPVAQKQVSRQCQIAAKPCLVQRNSLATFANSQNPSQADLFDLANIVFDHADGVLLTLDELDESLVGEAIRNAQTVLQSAESFLEVTDRPFRVGFGQPPNTAALAYAIRHLLKLQEIAAVAVYSISGTTARVISKNWLDTPIMAFAPHEATARRMVLCHGVTSRLAPEPLNTAGVLLTASEFAKELGIALPGDRIIIVSGHPDQLQDQANGFVIETVTD